jgi:hypothetical protein
MKASTYLLLLAALAAIISAGCSSGGTPLAPDVGPGCASGNTPHALWGLYQFSYDPESQSLEIACMRSSAMHLNALPFLEPPPLVFVSLDGLELDPSDANHITALIGIRHPFLGLMEFTGFDVCGILIGHGSAEFGSSGLQTAADNQTRLLNPDGFSRWWNPDEFPSDGTMFSYKDGLLGTPDAIAEYDAQVNGYKFYCSAFGLGNPDEPLDFLDPTARHEFDPGEKVIRQYDIQFGETGWIFNYAIDANWVFPQGSLPWSLDDFPEGANSPEAWFATTAEIENTLWNYSGSAGGSLVLSVRVFDHFNPELNEITISSPGNLNEATVTIPEDYGSYWADYLFEFIDEQPGQSGTIPLYIEAACEESDYGGHLPGEPVTAYFIAETTVSDEPMQIADPPENVWIEVLRSDKADEFQSIDGLKVHWDAVTGAVEYAVYYDDDPYDGVTPATLMGATTELEYEYDMSSSNLNEAFVFIVRSRTVAGNPATESDDSDQAFVEFEGFEVGGTNPGPWGAGNESSAATFLLNLTSPPWVNSGQYYAGNVGGNGYHSGQSWTILYSPELPDILNMETVAFELVHKHYQVNTDSGIQMGTMSTPPAANSGSSTYTDFDGTNGYIGGTAYNQSYEYAIYWKFGDPTNHWQYHLPETAFLFSAYDCLGGYSGGHRHVGIGYATTSGNDIIWVSFDDIAVVIY